MNHKHIFFTIIVFVLGMVCSCATHGESEKNDTDENATRMQKFVEDISLYARRRRPGFIIIPQNGAELAFNNTDTIDGIRSSYIDAIDGIGIEELFYNDRGVSDSDGERLAMLRKIKSNQPRMAIIVSDYVSNNSIIADSVRQNQDNGFIPFPRSAENYHYKIIPENIIDENVDDINALSDAKNYLYLINGDNYSTKQAMLSAIAATNYDVVLIDLFFGDKVLTPENVQQLKTKANGGRRLVVSYLSIGSAENYRYYWKPKWKKGDPSWLKKNYEGYPDELWVEFWHPEWQNIIFGNDESYIKKIIDAGFDGAYLDNVEAYYFLSE